MEINQEELLSRSSIKLLVLIATAIFLTGCLSNKLNSDLRHECPFNGAVSRDSGKNFDPESIGRPSPNPIVKILRFTEEGELADRCEWSDALFEVKGNPESSSSKLVVLYVHGWKHDASRSDSDLASFEEFIEQLTSHEENRKSNRDVVGLFIAWPGLSTRLPIVNNLTFWGRKGAADRISATANISKFISSVNSVRRQRKNPNDFVVGVGHSFGARVLFSAVSPVLLNELSMKHPGRRLGNYGKVDGVMDLTILLNPAFEASRYTPYNSIRRWQETFDKKQNPLLITISTRNDYATRFAFPLGQVLGTRWHEREYTTLGNHSKYLTHVLENKTGSGVDFSDQISWYDNYCRSGLCLSRRSDNPYSGSPFIVASTDSTVLNGHNGIWSDSFRSWLAAFIERSSSLSTER